MNDTAESLAAAIADVIGRGEVAVLATLIEGPPEVAVGAKILIGEGGLLRGSTGDDELDKAINAYVPAFLASRAEAATVKATEFGVAHPGAARDARVLFERIEAEPRVVVCGAGHVGAALARLAYLIGYRVTLIDDRVDFLARARFPEEEIELIVAAEGWAAALAGAIRTGRGVFVAVVTRGHNEDEECLRAVLEVRPSYTGLIGSRRRTNIVLGRLRETGVEEELLREVRAPIGLDLGAVTPEEVALAILAEIVAERRGGAGASLSAWRRAPR